MNILGKWIFNILVSIDQFGNTLFGGDPDETISSRLGKLKKKHNGRIPWSRPLSKIIDWGLDRIDKNHSINSIEKDEGKNALLDKERKDDDDDDDDDDGVFGKSCVGSPDCPRTGGVCWH